MGYTTDFEGKFTVTLPLAPEHMAYLKMFSQTRRMKRGDAVQSLPDLIREAVGLVVGVDGAFFVGGTGLYGQDRDSSVADYNSPPYNQPSLWCHWEPSADGRSLQWNDGEKFYHYEEWLNYLISIFLKPWGYELTGEVSYNGEDREDFGMIRILNGVARRCEHETIGDIKGPHMTRFKKPYMVIEVDDDGGPSMSWFDEYSSALRCTEKTEMKHLIIHAQFADAEYEDLT